MFLTSQDVSRGENEVEELRRLQEVSKLKEECARAYILDF